MRANANADIHAAGDHRLLRLTTTLRIEHFQHQAVLLEDAGILPEFGD